MSAYPSETRRFSFGREELWTSRVRLRARIEYPAEAIATSVARGVVSEAREAGEPPVDPLAF